MPQRAIIGSPLPDSRYLPIDERYLEAYDLKQSGFSGHITAISQDSSGFLWVGLSSGLTRFDGHQFAQLFDENSQALSLSNAYVSALLPLDNGEVLIATRTTGLYLWNGRSLQPIPIESNNTNTAYYALYRDSRDRILIGAESGLLLFSLSSQKVEKSFATLPVHEILRSLTGTLFLGYSKGMARFDLNTGTETKIRGEMAREIEVIDSANGPLLVRNKIALAEVQVSSLYEDTSGRLWLASEGGSAGYLNDEHTRAIPLSYNTSSELEFQHRWVYAIAQPSADEMWFAIPEGIEVVNPDTKRVSRHILMDPTLKQGLQNSIARALFVDRTGMVWIGTHETFLHKYNPANHAIQTWRHTPVADTFSTQSPLTHPNVRSVFEDKDGRVWAGTSHFGVDVVDRIKGQVDNIRADPSDPMSLRDATVHSITQTADGDMWIGGGIGLARFTSPSYRKREYRKQHGLPSEFIRVLVTAPSGDVWVGTPEGLRVISPSTHSVTPVSAIASDLDTASIRTIAFTADGTAYVGTDLGLFSVNNGKVKALDNEAHQIPRGAVRSIASDRSRAGIWLMSSAGLGYFDGMHFSLAPTANGKPVFSDSPVVVDQRGDVWVFPFRFSSDSQQVISLSAADGASIGTISPNSGLLAASGDVVYGGSSGVMVIKPNLIRPYKSTIPATITRLLINGESADVTLSDKLQVSPNPRSIVVEFTRLDFYQPATARFEYRLLGFDSNWTPTTADNRRATYTNLGPGPYTLEIKTYGHNGVPIESVTQLSLTIEAAWYQTTYFSIFVVVVSGVCIVGFYRFRLWRLRERASWLEEQVESRTFELKSAQQQLVMQEKLASLGTLTAGVAHEINNPVSFTKVMINELGAAHTDTLTFLIELAGGNDIDPDIKSALDEKFNQLGKLTNTAQSGLGRIQSIVTDLKLFTRLDRAELEVITLEALLTTTIHLVRTRFDHIEFDIQVKSNPQLECYPARLNQVLMNIIVNSCEAIESRQNSHAKLQGLITCTLAEQDDNLMLTITDNGIGMDEQVSAKMFDPFYTTKDVGKGTGLGLSISYGVIAEHNGTISARSVLGEGTSITISLPIQTPSTDHSVANG